MSCDWSQKSVPQRRHNRGDVEETTSTQIRSRCDQDMVSNAKVNLAEK